MTLLTHAGPRIIGPLLYKYHVEGDDKRLRVAFVDTIGRGIWTYSEILESNSSWASKHIQQAPTEMLGRLHKHPLSMMGHPVQIVGGRKFEILSGPPEISLGDLRIPKLELTVGDVVEIICQVLELVDEDQLEFVEDGSTQDSSSICFDNLLMNQSGNIRLARPARPIISRRDLLALLDDMAGLKPEQRNYLKPLRDKIRDRPLSELRDDSFLRSHRGQVSWLYTFALLTVKRTMKQDMEPSMIEQFSVPAFGDDENGKRNSRL